MSRQRVTERTIRRRIASGDLLKRERSDGKVEVWVTEDTPMTSGHDTSEDSHVTPVMEANAERALALVDRVNESIQQQVGPLLQLVRDQQQQLLEFATENGQLRNELERLRAIASHDVADDRHVTSKETWWHRWLGL
jgi:hypothetical protein